MVGYQGASSPHCPRLCCSGSTAMGQLPKAYEEAQSRLTTKLPLAEETHRRAQEGTLRFLDSEWLPKRIDRLLRNPIIGNSRTVKGISDELRITGGLGGLSSSAHSELERVIDGADFMPSWFLSRGSELRRTVARVRARTASGKDKKGTGFLVGPRLLLTNAHVLDWTDIGEESAENTLPYSLAEFDYEEQFNGAMMTVSTFRLEPTTLCLFSPWDQLDYVLVALAPRSNEGTDIASFGYNLLAGDTGKISKGEAVFIVQHPNGQPKKVVLQNNRLIDRDEAVPYLTYEADTEAGSSGAPVFNRQWEVVALHHAPEIARDPAGQILAKNGTPWTPAMGSGQVKYLRLNEGVRVSRIMTDWALKAEKLQQPGANSLTSPERCSPAGLDLLNSALQAHKGASPAALVVPIPVERDRLQPLLRAPEQTSRFPRPE